MMAAVLLVGCSSEMSTDDAGSDGGVRVDAATTVDAGLDGASPDSGDATDAGLDGAVSDAATDARVDGGIDAGTDAGTDAGFDAGTDAGFDAGTDAGFDAGFDAGHDAGVDAGHDAGFDAGFDAGHDAGFDAGHDAGFDAGHDAGFDAGYDAGFDAGFDAGHDAGFDAGFDAGYDAGFDAGFDAGYDAGSDAGCPITTLVSETFESTSTIGAHPAGWMEGCMGGSSYSWGASSIAVAGSRGLMTDFRGSGGEAAVGIPVTWPSSGTVEVRFWARTEQTTQNVYVLPVRGDVRLINSVPFQRTGELMSPGSGVFYTVGTWYEFVYELNFDTSTWRTLVDGVEYATGSFFSATLPCNLSGGDYLSIHGGYVDQKTLTYFDNVTITARPSGC